MGLIEHGPTEELIIREFVPKDSDDELSGGRLVVRTGHYGSSLAKFDRLFAAIASDALNFEPPANLSREDVSVAHFAGDRYARTFGLEAVIPAGHQVSGEYIRIERAEQTY